MADRKVDELATHGTPKKLKETRKQRNPMNHPELRRELSPTRQKKVAEEAKKAVENTTKKYY